MGLPTAVTNTPKMDMAINEFGQRIAEPATFNVAGKIQDGKFLKAADYEAYINKAMLKMFNDAWIQTGDDVKKFLTVFPEMVAVSGPLTFIKETVQGTTEALVSYQIDAPYLDFVKLVSASMYLQEPIKVFDETMFTLIATGKNPYYQATAEDMIIIPLGKKLCLFPREIESATDIFITYIKSPVNPDTGLFITQAGDYDIPFGAQWISRIAELAEEFFRREAQEES